MARWSTVSNPHRYGQKLKEANRKFVQVKFQTLIGTVKSLPPGHHPVEEKVVSNPHRYGQKAEAPGCGGRITWGFKPS